MTRISSLIIAVAVLSSAGAVSLRATNKTVASANVSAKVAKIAPTQKDVDATREHLEKVAVGLSDMLKSEALGKSHAGPGLKVFVENLKSVLGDTKGLKPEIAMQKLEAAQAGVASLVGSLTKQQESLMKEDFDQRESLLLGVLLTNQKESMSKQFEILGAADFSGLDVSRELLRAHDNSTALYIQAAKYLDAHKKAGGSAALNRSNHVEEMAAALDKRVVSLEKEGEAQERRHQKKVTDLAKMEKKGGKDAKLMQATLKRENRDFKKWSAQRKHDIQSMKDASAAVRSGDVKALDRARSALLKSIEAMKNKNGGMLVFLQKGNAFLERDCPYCAAQCVEKCHNRGEPYTSCLGECADAGKGF